MTLLPEENFAEAMTGTVEPYLAALRRTGYTSSGIYYETYIPERPRGVVVISHGFTEAAVKFRETVYYLLQAGYGAAAVDHRGHGKSPRLTGDPCVVHIDKFSRYVDDLRGFTKEVVTPAAGGAPLYIFGHSMGGCVAALLIEEEPDLFRKAVLNAPMLGILIGGNLPWWAAVAACRVMIALRRGATKLYYHSDFNPEARFEDDYTTSRARFDYYHKMRRECPELQTSAASYHWAMESVLAGRRAVKNAARATVPTLLFSAGKENLVDNAAQERFAAAAPQTELVRVPAARHEIYRSDNGILAGYWEKILGFLGE